MNICGKTANETRKKFTNQEVTKRHSQGRFTLDELNNLTEKEKKLLGLNFDKYLDKAKEAS